MDTVIESPSRRVVIGSERPFCIIGERINPTGRKSFQAQLQAGDLSQVEIDVGEQPAADVLDVNVGDPLADEIGLMAQAIPLAQGLTDQPLCIDSSVIERIERASDPLAACLDLAYEQAAHAMSLPGVAGLHFISFRKDAGIAKTCRRLGIPTYAERVEHGYGSPVAV